MKYFFIILFLLSFAESSSQQSNTLYRIKSLAVKDSIKLDSVSINPSSFFVTSLMNKRISPSSYIVDFQNASLKFVRPIIHDSIRVNYLSYPTFMTRTYQEVDDSQIVNRTGNLQKLYKLSMPSETYSVSPFDGLISSGSLSRGITVGNNQNSVLNSELDLQISGKLNNKVTLRASIQDSNIPLQESGYSQRLDEFDQVFIELFSDKWKIRAGDIDLKNTESYYASFSKRVQGLSLTTISKNELSEHTTFASGALVRGQFTTSQFVAQEGNQGPYKLIGSNNELYILVVSGSETVFVNGVPLSRGATEDYIIDYNSGEITFNSTYPITSEMRVTVDYQSSTRNYSRFIGYAGSQFKTDKWSFGASVYNESDLKNQPLQQSIGSDQIAILSTAGDDQTLMNSPSASLEPYNENRILYKKTEINGLQVFEFSNNDQNDLYIVNFTMVGPQNGNYIIASSDAISNIYEYIPPVNGVKQGDYEPIVRLIAPVKLQLTVLNGSYNPNENTSIGFELAASNNDLNLYSSLDDQDNTGVATQFSIAHQFLKSSQKWKLNLATDIDYVQKNFRNLEGMYNPEFNRDWNLEQPTNYQLVTDLGDQVFIKTSAQLLHPELGQFNYHLQRLSYNENYDGSRHVFLAKLKLNRFHLFLNSSILNTEGVSTNSKFYRLNTKLNYSYSKGWAGVGLSSENNQKKQLLSNVLDPVSQKFRSYEFFNGIGDSTKVFAKIGYIHRVNDSLQNNRLVRVNTSNTYYLDSKWIQTKKTLLSLYANYRNFKSNNSSSQSQKSINSRLQYSQKIANNLINWNTVYETNAGRLPQQDFTYVEVEPGQGSYVWFDYNDNGIQELEEFEVAQFQDQAIFVRILLPNQVYIRTHQNKLSQSITINPTKWVNSINLTKKLLSHFYNQTTYLIDKKDKNNSKFIRLNPFQSNFEDQLALQSNFRNQLFFNRGKQDYTISYSYIDSKARNVLSFGYIKLESISHQINITHKIKDQWLFNLQTNFDDIKSKSENFSSKNYQLNQSLINPKLSYLLDDNKRFDVFYQ